MRLEWQLDEHRSDELGVLENSLNTLSRKLSATLEELQSANLQLQKDIEHQKVLEQAQQDFFSSASHELKTPITIIKGQLEGMLLGIGAYKDHEKYLARSLEVAATLETMVQEILTISRLETNPKGTPKCFAILGVHSKKGLVNTMKRIALCAASMLLLGCLAGCSTTPQNSQKQDDPIIKEEISQPLGGSEALGNSEDSSALSAADKEKMFAPYEQYGMNYDAVKDELTYNGNLVRWFEDYYPIGNNETAGIDFLNENGTVDVYAVRDLGSFSKAADGSVDPAGKLIGLKEFTQQAFDARDIEALKNSTSVAMAGTPLEDSEIAKLVAEYEAFGVTYDAEKDQWYFNGEEVRYFRDVLTSNGESLTSGKFRGEMRTLGSGVGTIDIYTVRDYGHLNSEHHGTLTGIEKYSQEEFDEHTQAGISGNQPIGNASNN
ncbi:MAG: histidine kinase dimerization/phospho-acceptor domain-containing protein [Ruthenibacterium lactatiformans]|uniref:histidine kinase dimerization/phospho-acceptor domain-containing protein n=1 Tax=Ruthenibacterium lactatiformans TaxID=1550024 RepID=UPI003990F9E5